MIGLRTRLLALLRRLGATGDAGPLAHELLAAWSEPERQYHAVDHLRDCLAELDRAPDEGADRDRVEAALWFHDAVYDPRASDNEARSAEWACRALTGIGISPAVAYDVQRLVLLTRHAALASDADGRLLCDVDLAVLGGERDTFDEYQRRIRAEYAWVPESDYRAARRRLLAGLLARSPLYATVYFRGRYEAAARENLHRALSALEKPA